MIKGEKSNVSSSAIAGTDLFDEFLPWLNQRSDVDSFPSPSSYSSCEESEFERYCSANSILGTASLCSSVGTYSELLGSNAVSAENLGIGRNLGGRDCDVPEGPGSLSDGGNEALEENAGFGKGCSYGSNPSLHWPDVNSSLYGADFAENENGSFSKLTAGSGEIFKRQSGICLANGGRNANSARDGGGFSELELDVNGHLLLEGSSRNCFLYEIDSVESNEMNSLLSSSGIGVRYLTEAAEKSVSARGLHKDKNVEHPADCERENLVFCDQQSIIGKCIQNDGRDIGEVQEADDETSCGGECSDAEEVDEETSYKGGHSDVDDSMLGSGTDTENRSHTYECRNLQYLKENTVKNEYKLLMNAIMAFGSDDWDEFLQETEEKNMAFMPLEKHLMQQEEENSRIQEVHLESRDSSLDAHVGAPSLDKREQEEHVRDIRVASCQDQDIDISVENSGGRLDESSLVEELSTQTARAEKSYLGRDTCSAEGHLIIMNNANEREVQCACNDERTSFDVEGSLKSMLGPNPPLHPPSEVDFLQLRSTMTDIFQNQELGLFEDQEVSSPSSLAGKNDMGMKPISNDSVTTLPLKVEKLETDEFYNDMVHEMEEILLDSRSPRGRYYSLSSQRSVSLASQLSQTFRDGSSTASTSGADDVYLQMTNPPKIDWVEVVGAKQRRGDVSFGERLVGVKEYTVYLIRVWSGNNQWEVERRYRDFFTLYCQLKAFFTENGCSLPSPWSSIDRESRKVFGNASPNVISERSILIQDCIRSILQGSPLGIPSSLVWFLYPLNSHSKPSKLKDILPQFVENFTKEDILTSSLFKEASTIDTSTLGKTISLVVEIKPRKSVEHLLEAQCYTCAGCHQRLNVGRSLMQELVKTLGWGKPRLCEYTGQLFCSSCHTNDCAFLPARVLHFWDFSLYPVSQLAIAYLESIHDKPMLCVSAVNPFLFSKVPTLLHVMGIRKKIAAMLPYLQCPFQLSIQRGLGTRRYLLENNEFFALRDLVDLSKGAFAVLPAIIETVSMKIVEHITQRCLICCDVGIPCGARQACDDPASLIFSFQKTEVIRCSSCNSVFHKPCYRKIISCPCSAPVEVSERPNHLGGNRTNRNDLEESLNTLTRMRRQKSALGFFSDLWRPRNDNHVILMGSLPSTAL